MIEHTYFVCKSSWCISITIFAEYTSLDHVNQKPDETKIADGIWLKFADKPMVENERFCEDDLYWLAKGLRIVQREILVHSIYPNTLIIIHSLRLNVCDFQEEGLTAAMVEWASIAFGFPAPAIRVDFDKKTNRYLFDFEHDL